MGTVSPAIFHLKAPALLLCRGLLGVLALLLSATLHAQESGLGGLRGIIVDADFFVPVAGASVTLEPGGQGARTDEEGRFFIQGLPPAAYRLAVQAEGFVRTSKSGVVVQAGAVREVDLEMTAQVVELDEFVVQDDVETGATEIAPLSLGADLSAFASAISPELMKTSSSSGDIGSSLRRLAGVSVADSRYVVVRGLSDRYNVVVLNGARIPSSDPDKRAVNIDIFPTGLVETIVSAKTVTASMPGEVTGGYLNILTKRVPDQPFFNVSMSTGYNTNSTGRSDFLSYKGGGTGFLGSAEDRALPGIMRDVNALPSDVREYLGDANGTPLNPNDPGAIVAQNRLAAAAALRGRPMGTSYKTAPEDFSFSVVAGTRVEDFMGGTLGLIGGITYGKKYVMEEGIRGFANVGAGTPAATELFQYARGTETLLAGALLSASLEFSPEDSITLTYFANVSAQDDAIFSIGETANLGSLDNGVPIEQEEIVVFREFMYYTERSLQTLQLAGQHSIDGMTGVKIDWLAAYSESSQDQPDLRKANYAFSYALNDYVGTGDPAPPDLERVWRRLDDTNYNVALNAEIPLDEGAAQGGTGVKLKVGGAFDYSTRKYRSDNFEYFGLPAASLISDYLNLTPGSPILGLPTADNGQTQTLGDLIGDVDFLDQVLGRIDLLEHGIEAGGQRLKRGPQLVHPGDDLAQRVIEDAHAGLHRRNRLVQHLGQRVDDAVQLAQLRVDLAEDGIDHVAYLVQLFGHGVQGALHLGDHVVQRHRHLGHLVLERAHLGDDAVELVLHGFNHGVHPRQHRVKRGLHFGAHGGDLGHQRAQPGFDHLVSRVQAAAQQTLAGSDRFADAADFRLDDRDRADGLALLRQIECRSILCRLNDSIHGRLKFSHGFVLATALVIEHTDLNRQVEIAVT